MIATSITAFGIGPLYVTILVSEIPYELGGVLVDIVSRDSND